jgi:hypothetical protein
VLEPGSIRFWTSPDGSKSLEPSNLQEQGNRAHGQRERFLSTLIQAEQRRLGRPLEVLELGRGAVDEDPLVSAGQRRFDLVFSESVLIHKPSQSLPGLLDTLGRLVRPEGLVCLMENPLVPFSVQRNDGVWLHAYAEAMPPGWDLHHGSGFTDTQDLYLLKRNGSQARRYFDLKGPEQARDESHPLTHEVLQARALPRLRTWADEATAALQRAASGDDPRVQVAQERLQVETERFQRRQRLLGLAEDLAGLRNRSVRPSPSPEPTPAAARHRGVLFDDPADTTWAHVVPELSRVVHVFHQQWHGIRAAAGYSPGRKLAITAERSLSRKEMRQAVEFCASFTSPVILVHSFSAYAHELIVALRKVLGRSVRILSVWHGSTAQFHYDYECDTFANLMELRLRGLIDGVACVKPDMHLVSGRVFPKTLLNLPPRVDAARRRPVEQRSHAALIPTPNDWRKNFYTNLYACMAAPSVRQVYATARFIEPKGLSLTKPVQRLKSPGRGELFEVMRKVDVVLNASLSECQPMTALEGLALRVPCITGPLGLGSLDEHPYQRLTQLARVDMVGPLRDAIEQVMELQGRSPRELVEMMDSYESLLCSEAVRRYQEFIHS